MHPTESGEVSEMRMRTGATMTSRRRFCAGAGALMVMRGRLVRAAAQMGPASVATALRPDVAAIDHERIMAAANEAMSAKMGPVTALSCPRSPGSANDYYSEAEDLPVTAADAGKRPGPQAFTAHRDAVFALGERVSALAAAYVLTSDARFAERAASELRVWFVDPTTSMRPRLEYGHVVPVANEVAPAQRAAARPGPMTMGERIAAADAAARGAGAGSGESSKAAASSESAEIGHTASSVRGGTFEGILETLPLVEVAQAIPFIAAAGVLSNADRKAINAWFRAYLSWLTEEQIHGPRLPALARDHKDHHASSWLLQVSAYTLLTTPESGEPKAEAQPVNALRRRFQSVILRSQVSAEGAFPHELTSATAYRDSLFNLDLLAAICQLLTTRFDDVWEYQLEDGPSMRGAIAFHFPLIADRAKWPYKADQAHFTELPGRRASLLFAAKAYQRPEYATVWKTLPADVPDEEIRRTMPVRQPLLWVRQAARAAG